MRLFALLVSGLLAGSAVQAQDARPPKLVETVDRYRNLQVADQSAAVANLKLVSEHLQCVLGSGRAAYVRAGDEVIGVFFEGTGSMDYLSANPIEAPVLAYVAKKSTRLSPEKTDQGLRVKDKFTRLLWLALPAKMPELTGLEPRPLTASFQEHEEKFLRIRGRRPGFALGYRQVAAPNALYAWVEMEGGAEDLRYVRDGMDDAFEQLSFVHGPSSGEVKVKDMLFATVLSEQPTGRDPKDPPKPRFLMTDVDLELKASTDKDVSLSVVETVVPQGEPLDVFRFDLDNGLFTTFGLHLESRTEHLRKVTDEKGRTLAFYHGDHEVFVQTREPVAAGQSVKLRFELDGDFLVHPGGSNFWELGVRAWFPQPRWCEQYYTFHAVIRVRKPFVPFAPGKTIRRVEEGGDNVLEVQVDVPIQFPVILAGDYTFKEEVRDGVTIRVATYALKNDRAIKQLTDLAATIIRFYQEFLGAFPFPEFNILEIDSLGFGQAPPGVMFITKEAFNPLGGGAIPLEEAPPQAENQIYSGGVNERFAHEIAHQYWAHVVKMPSHEEQWLTESFAEYSAALFIKAAKGEREYKSLVNHWTFGARQATDKAPIPLANRVYVADDVRTQFFTRTGLLYEKGPLLLYALHQELGDQTFLTFLKSYQKSFRWKFGSTKTVVGLLNFLTKKDYNPFFDANFWGTGMPKE